MSDQFNKWYESKVVLDAHGNMTSWPSAQEVWDAALSAATVQLLIVADEIRRVSFADNPDQGDAFRVVTIYLIASLNSLKTDIDSGPSQSPQLRNH